MEVWLESLSMHLSVCMPIPSDLLFDIYHYRGLSPSSSGSTTPEGIASESRSPNLEPIKEGKMHCSDSTTQRSNNNVSNENLKAQEAPAKEKQYIKKSTNEIIQNSNPEKLYAPIESQNSKLKEKVSKINELDVKNNKTVISKTNSIDDNSISVKNKSNIIDVNSSKKYNIPNMNNRCNNNKSTEELAGTSNSLLALKKVPKHFTRNRFRHHCQEVPEISSISASLLPKLKYASRNQFEVNRSSNNIAQSTVDSLDSRNTKIDNHLIANIPDIVSSCTVKRTQPLSVSTTSLTTTTTAVNSNMPPSKLKLTTNTCNNIPGCSSNSSSTTTENKIKKTAPSISGISGVNCDVRNPISKSCASSSKSSSIVKNIVDTLNRNENKMKTERLYTRRTKNEDKNKSDTKTINLRCSSPVESTAL